MLNEVCEICGAPLITKAKKNFVGMHESKDKNPRK